MAIQPQKLEIRKFSQGIKTVSFTRFLTTSVSCTIRRKTDLFSSGVWHLVTINDRISVHKLD
jgi:hypothetical protein